MSITRALLAAAVCWLGLFNCGWTYGQATGSISGTVADSAGGAVAGAKVTVTSTAKSFAYDTTTNESGNYSVTHLIPDTYKVHIEAAGFQITEIASVVLNADTAATVDAHLLVGAVTQTVEVTGEVPQLHELRIAYPGHAEVTGFQPRCHGESSGQRTNRSKWAAFQWCRL